MGGANYYRVLGLWLWFLMLAVRDASHAAIALFYAKITQGNTQYVHKNSGSAVRIVCIMPHSSVSGSQRGFSSTWIMKKVLFLLLMAGQSYGEAVSWMDSTEQEVAVWTSMIENPNHWVDATLSIRTNLTNRSEWLRHTDQMFNSRTERTLSTKAYLTSLSQWYSHTLVYFCCSYM